MRRTGINLGNNLGERRGNKEAAAGNDKTEPGTTACEFGFFSGLIGRRGRLASRIRDPQQTDEVPNNSFWCCLLLGLFLGLS